MVVTVTTYQTFILDVHLWEVDDFGIVKEIVLPNKPCHYKANITSLSQRMAMLIPSAKFWEH